MYNSIGDLKCSMHFPWPSPLPSPQSAYLTFLYLISLLPCTWYCVYIPANDSLFSFPNSKVNWCQPYSKQHYPSKSRRHSVNWPYLAYILGCVPCASRIRIGMFGLFFFIVGYARLMNDLLLSQHWSQNNPFSIAAIPFSESLQLTCHNIPLTSLRCLLRQSGRIGIVPPSESARRRI